MRAMRATQATTKVSHLLVTALDDHPGRNPNVMLEDDYRRLVRAIQRVGFLQPVLVRACASGRFTIVDGHHRIRAARELGLEKVPCVVAEIDDDVALALQIGMNKLRGSVDLGAAGEIVSTLAEAGWSVEDLQLSGYSDDELNELIKSARTSSEDVMESADASLPDEDPQADILSFGAFDVLQCAKAHRDRGRGIAIIERVGGVGAGFGRGVAQHLRAV